MRYIIIGAGAIGGTIGARLFEAGFDVVLVARGRHFSALRDGGLRFTAPDGTRTLPIQAADGPIPLADGDVLVLTTKTQDTGPALDIWAEAPVEGGGTAAERLPIVCAQNAVENERLALRRFSRVYGMLVWLPALHLIPGVVVSYGAPLSGMLPVGCYPQGVDDVAERIAADFAKSGFATFASPEIMRWKYAKLLGNLGNAIEAMCGHAPGWESVAARLRAEGQAVLDAAGIPYATEEDERTERGDKVRHVTIEGVERPGGSTWQSLAKRSGTIECDYLNGEIVLLGRLHGVPTPANECMQRESARFAREGRTPGSMTIPELIELVDSYG